VGGIERDGCRTGRKKGRCAREEEEERRGEESVEQRNVLVRWRRRGRSTEAALSWIFVEALLGFGGWVGGYLLA